MCHEIEIEVTECAFILPLNGRKCTNEAWAEGQPFCLQHDLWQTMMEYPRDLEETNEWQAVARFLDLRYLPWQPFDAIDDEALQLVLERRYGKRTDLYVFIGWIREVIAFQTPSKNVLPL